MLNIVIAVGPSPEACALIAGELRGYRGELACGRRRPALRLRAQASAVPPIQPVRAALAAEIRNVNPAALGESLQRCLMLCAFISLKSGYTRRSPTSSALPPPLSDRQ